MDFDVRRGNYTFKSTKSVEIPYDTTGSFREHFHSLYELLYFIGGEADFRISHTRYTLKPHSLLVAKPGELHHMLIKSEKPYERMVVRFDEADVPSGFRKHLKTLGNVYQIENTPLADEMTRLATHDAALDGDPRFYAMRWRLNLILTYLCSSQELKQSADEVNEDVFRIMQYIDAHLTEINTLEDLCASLHMSRSNLHKIFSSRFDTPIMSYIRTQKATLAHTLLNDGFLPTEIPEKCGFNNYSSFYRTYLRIYEKPPSAAKA